jgi:UDP-N-acetylglucosamine--N-acetylmuramyl-(pentapeptide) pyrophosphoryl-undecaprenol N-acetylglucosamine transferase
VRGKGLKTLVQLPFRLAKAFSQARAVMKRVQPDVVIGLGGYLTVPGGLMAALRACPWCCTSRTPWPAWPTRSWPGGQARVHGFPQGVCQGRMGGQSAASGFLEQAEPAQRFAGRSGPLKLLVVGGSLGARALNEIVPQALALMPADQRPWCCTRAARPRSMRCVPTIRRRRAGRADPFIDDTAKAFADADLIVCRAGASTVTEIAAVGRQRSMCPFRLRWMTTRPAMPASWWMPVAAGYSRKVL